MAKDSYNYLEEFSKAIEEQGRRQREEDNARLVAYQNALPEEVAKLSKLSNQELLDLHRQPFFTSDPRMMTLYQTFNNAVHEELLKRLSKVPAGAHKSRWERSKGADII